VIKEALVGQEIALRPVRPDDKDRLTGIFSDAAVAVWWGDPSRAVEDAMNAVEDESCFVIERGDEAIGFIQCFEEEDPMYRHASIDIALLSEWQGKGIGPEAIRMLVTYLIKELGHHRVTIDPAAHNTRAIKAYRSVGFRPVGVLRQYERGPSGDWHDGLLMDLLAEDLAGDA
jgi:aminoglycoside 6'-N-acetyltransferase